MLLGQIGKQNTGSLGLATNWCNKSSWKGTRNCVIHQCSWFSRKVKTGFSQNEGEQRTTAGWWKWVGMGQFSLRRHNWRQQHYLEKVSIFIVPSVPSHKSSQIRCVMVFAWDMSKAHRSTRGWSEIHDHRVYKPLKKNVLQRSQLLSTALYWLQALVSYQGINTIGGGSLDLAWKQFLWEHAALWVFAN